MKQFTLGLVTIVVLGFAGFYAFRATTSLLSRLFPPSSPAASATPIPSATPTPTPKSTPAPAYTPQTTKGGLPAEAGLVKGVSTVQTTTTTTTKTWLTLIKTSACPANFTSEVRDITAPLTLRYSLKDGYAANVVVWKRNGEEILSKREVKGSGELMRVTNTDYLKLEISSSSCSSTSDTWLNITAER